MGKNRAFNINHFERSIFSFTDRADRVLLVRMPRKQVFDRMTDLQKQSSDADFTTTNDILNELLSEVLSNNKQGREITSESISEEYDFEEKLEIFTQYMSFVTDAANNPN